MQLSSPPDDLFGGVSERIYATMRILGSDYDGTLTHKLGPATFAAISAWRQAGNLFGIVSGRPVSFREEVLARYPELELDFFVGFNGAVITDGEGHMIFEKCCTEVTATELTECMLSLGCPFIHVNSDRYFCVVARDEDRPTWVDPADIISPEELPVLPYFHQISTQFPGNEAAAKQVTAALKETYGDRLNPLQNGTCIDIPHITINKTQGLLRVAEHFGAGSEDLIAVGDNVNDTDMIRDLYSYAMETGVESIKFLADRTTESVAALIMQELYKA